MKLVKKFNVEYDYDEWIESEDYLLNGEMIEGDVKKNFLNDSKELDSFEFVYSDGQIIDRSYRVHQFKFKDNDYVVLTLIPLYGEGDSYGFNFDYSNVYYKVFLMENDDAQVFETRKGFFKILHDIIDINN